MLLLLAFVMSYTLHAKDVLQPPPRAPLEAWQSGERNREPLELAAADGTPLRGWLYRADPPDAPFVLFFPGSNEDLVHEANRLAWLRDTMHVNAVCFDYPGYGFSGGGVSVVQTRAAALVEFDYIRQHLARQHSTPVIVYGWSIGSGFATAVALSRPASGIILQAPPATATAMAAWSSKHDVPSALRWAVHIKMDAALDQLYGNAEAVHHLTAPLLVIQGTLDEVVPITQGREVFAASASERKQFVEVQGAHHNDLRVTQPPASTAIYNFFAGATNRSVTPSAGESHEPWAITRALWRSPNARLCCIGPVHLDRLVCSLAWVWLHYTTR